MHDAVNVVLVASVVVLAFVRSWCNMMYQRTRDDA